MEPTSGDRRAVSVCPMGFVNTTTSVDSDEETRDSNDVLFYEWFKETYSGFRLP